MTSTQVNGLNRFRLSSAPKRSSVACVRRPHTKSRAGCRTCKADRIKCDEAHPQCGRCIQRQSICTYEESTGGNPAPGEAPKWYVSSSLPDSLLEDTLGLYRGHDTSMTKGHSGMAMTPSTHLVQILGHCVGASISSVVGRDLMNLFILPSCARSPMLMHSLLALCARYLQHLQPSSRSHNIAYMFHLHTSTKRFNKELTEVHVGAHNIDMIYATCLIISMLAFTMDDNTASDSWIFQDDGPSISESLVWFMIQEGMGILSGILRCNMDQSFWRLKFSSGVTLRNTLCYSGLEEVALTIHPRLMDIYEITSGCAPKNTPYYIPLCLLNRLLHMDKNGSSQLDSLLGFGPRVPRGYRTLVRKKDERALLLLMLWLMLLCRETYWWVAIRARNEFTAVSWYLSQSEDERIKCIAIDPHIIMR